MFSCMYNSYFLHCLALGVCLLCLVICMICGCYSADEGIELWFSVVYIYFAGGRSCGENRFFVGPR